MYRPLAINVPNFTQSLHTVLGVSTLDKAKFTIFVVTIIQKAIIWTDGGARGF